MSLEQKVKAVLQSAELVFELAIIDPTRYGPMIHANVPDYTEILLKIFLEEAGLPTTIKKSGKEMNYYQLVQAIVTNPGRVNVNSFKLVSRHFLDIRESFRNLLHHTHSVQGYIIRREEALECLLKFDELLHVLFPGMNFSEIGQMNYLCYIKFIRMQDDELRGRGDHNLFRKVMQALNVLEKNDNYKCPSDFDAARLLAIRRLFKWDEDTFSLKVLGYRKSLPERIAVLLSGSRRPIGSQRITKILKGDAAFGGIRKREVEACLEHIQGERIGVYGMILIQGGAYYINP